MEKKYILTNKLISSEPLKNKKIIILLKPQVDFLKILTKIIWNAVQVNL